MNLNLNRTHAASPIEEHKRQKLIPFPRVGKRQALIPFPRTGKRQSGWLIPFPRTGKRSGPGAPGPPGAAGTVADFLQQLEREREEAAHSQPTLAGAGGAASMKGQSSRQRGEGIRVHLDCPVLSASVLVPCSALEPQEQST